MLDYYQANIFREHILLKTEKSLIGTTNAYWMLGWCAALQGFAMKYGEQRLLVGCLEKLAKFEKDSVAEILIKVDQIKKRLEQRLTGL